MEQNPIEHRLLYCTLEDIHYQFLYSAPSVYRPPVLLPTSPIAKILVCPDFTH
jgi:hypothetical protein